jgi:signal transduction histidine kinase
VKAQLEFIQKEVMRCKKISQRFLNFFRASTDAQETVDIRAVIEDAIALIEAHPLCRSTDIQSAPAQNSLPVRAHSSDLIQLFLNLGINAIQAMNSQGSLQFEVATRPTAEAWLNEPTRDGCVETLHRSPQLQPTSPVVLISVKDTGPGIRADVIQKIFRPYFTTKEKGQGTGLGLAICARLLDKHQGALRFVSRLGEGTTATVCLPLVSVA